MLFLNIKTYSEVNLKEKGLEAYSKHPSTRILCIAFAFDNEEVRVWENRPGGTELPKRINEYIGENKPFAANDIDFHVAIWNNCLVPQRRRKNLSCEMLSEKLGNELSKDSVKMDSKEFEVSKPKEINQGKIVRFEYASFPEKYEEIYQSSKNELETLRKSH